jgi:hypothetical protein
MITDPLSKGTVLLKRGQGDTSEEHHKGGTDFCIRLTLLPKDQLGVKLEIIHLPGQ